MDLINWVAEATPKLSRPLMLVAFEGWFDAGNSATGALDWLLETAPAGGKLAEIDLEEFLDFQEVRPIVKQKHEGDRALEWPTVNCYTVEETVRHDLVLLQGVEPRMRWRTFNEAVLQVATSMKCQMIVTMGSTAASVPHSRMPTVKSSAGNTELAKRMGLAAPTYQGPTGVIGTLHDMADKANFPVISMRVGVPHYVAGPQNPKGTRALLAEFQHITGVQTHYNLLDKDVLTWEERVNEATKDDPEIVTYISQLEVESDRLAEESLPSGEDLAAQIEQFLMERNPHEDDL